MIGFIGTGNMGTAIIKGMLANNIDKSSIYANDQNEKSRNAMKELGLNDCNNNVEVAQKCKYIFLAIKPIVYDTVLKEINNYLTDDSVIIIMAAGYDIARVKRIIGEKKVVRIMPNTPALVCKGFTVVSFDELINNEEKIKVLDLLNTFGEVKEISENYINAYSALSGSSPAFIFMMIEAMADAAVLMGIPRVDAYKAAQYTVLGSAHLAFESGKHPGELKDMVCSPGGTTIEGVRTLEEKGFRSAMIESLLNTYKKNFDLSKIR
jgi:pyrroline-5-carboxylate reductase